MTPAQVWPQIVKRDRYALRGLATANDSKVPTSFASGTIKQWELTVGRLTALGLIRRSRFGLDQEVTPRGRAVLRWAAKHDPEGLQYFPM